MGASETFLMEGEMVNVIGQMEPVKVLTSDKGFVQIVQELDMSEPTLIELHPGQVDLLIDWLREAKAKLEGGSPTARAAEA
jgi:hypothetical protein